MTYCNMNIEDAEIKKPSLESVSLFALNKHFREIELEYYANNSDAKVPIMVPARDIAKVIWPKQFK